MSTGTEEAEAGTSREEAMTEKRPNPASSITYKGERELKECRESNLEKVELMLLAFDNSCQSGKASAK